MNQPISSNPWGNYRPQTFESKWQAAWEEADLYKANDSGDKPKLYVLDYFPYPSGNGLHVGHTRNYVPTDVISRFKRMQGFNVLHPMGWDSFGEPAEQYAILRGVHPRLTTDQNTANFRRQLRLVGTSYDWSREIDSSSPEYYRWTQWIFLLLYRRGLAYRDTNLQWWCPTCMTTLSSHEVNNGVCWRGHSGVTRKEIPAWYFRITAYAEELLSGLDEINWTEPVKAMQRNWIGRSEGCEIIFHTDDRQPVTVFTTRPDTLFGVTFLALAPEHPLVGELTTPEQLEAVQAYQQAASGRSELERLADSRQKTGVFSGGYVTNPLDGERVPVWIGDYVLPTYGSGAVMGVPAHDQRDLDFARQYGLPVRWVIQAENKTEGGGSLAYEGEGTLVDSGRYSGLTSQAGQQQISADLEAAGQGGWRVQYRMRDWLISRQRYWGTPIPIVYCPVDGEVPVPEDQLPVLLPDIADFAPDGSGKSALARVPAFVNTTCPRCGGPAQRETDTMGGFACSSWYFLRFTSPQYKEGPFEPEALRYWMPVDLYVGGAEHAVLHLLYARFWTKVMADAGLFEFREPFTRLMNQGQLMGPDGVRMSKSRGNVITPDAMVEAYGGDALRLYEMFMAPFDQDIAWNMDGMSGAKRFLARVWVLYRDGYVASRQATGVDAGLERALHKLIRQVTERLETFRFNTMVSAFMEFANLLSQRRQTGTWSTLTFHQALETYLVLLAPAAPYISEELWHLTGHSGSVHAQTWPKWDASLAMEELVEIAVQVDGKLRAVIPAEADVPQAELVSRAMQNAKVRQHTAGREIRKVVYIPGRVLNLVTGSNI